MIDVAPSSWQYFNKVWNISWKDQSSNPEWTHRSYKLLLDGWSSVWSSLKGSCLRGVVWVWAGEAMTRALLVIWEFLVVFLICERDALRPLHLIGGVLHGHSVSNVKAGVWLVDYFVVFLREREETPLSSTACSYVSWSFRKTKWQREPLGSFFKGSARMWCAEWSVLRSCLQSFPLSCTMAQVPR